MKATRSFSFTICDRLVHFASTLRRKNNLHQLSHRFNYCIITIYKIILTYISDKADYSGIDMKIMILNYYFLLPTYFIMHLVRVRCLTKGLLITCLILTATTMLLVALLINAVNKIKTFLLRANKVQSCPYTAFHNAFEKCTSVLHFSPFSFS